MNRSLKLTIIIIGILSLFTGGYSAFTGAEFNQYFTAFFLGATLIGTAVFYKHESTGEE